MMKSNLLDIDMGLRISAEEAAAGARRDVNIMRFVRCPSCMATYRRTAGCSACSDGLTTREEKLSVRVPAGIATGTRLRLAGKGHESTRDPVGDLFLDVHIVTPAPAAVSATPSVSATELRKQQRAKIAAVSICGVVALAGIGAFAHDHYSRAVVGAPCVEDRDCRSHECLGLYAEAESLSVPLALAPEVGTSSFRVGFPRRIGAICSRSCSGDEECPGGMRCAPATRSTTLRGMPDLGPGTPNTHVCVRAE